MTLDTQPLEQLERCPQRLRGPQPADERECEDQGRGRDEHDEADHEGLQATPGERLPAPCEGV